MRDEYQAVFSSPGGGGSHGPARDTLHAALRDRPDRAEETLESLTGIEHRQVGEWQAVPLAQVVKAMNDKAGRVV